MTRFQERSSLVFNGTHAENGFFSDFLRIFMLARLANQPLPPTPPITMSLYAYIIRYICVVTDTNFLYILFTLSLIAFKLIILIRCYL
jgi:hypothetical protein